MHVRPGVSLVLFQANTILPPESMCLSRLRAVRLLRTTTISRATATTTVHYRGLAVDYLDRVHRLLSRHALGIISAPLHSPFLEHLAAQRSHRLWSSSQAAQVPISTPATFNPMKTSPGKRADSTGGSGGVGGGGGPFSTLGRRNAASNTNKNASVRISWLFRDRD